MANDDVTFLQLYSSKPPTPQIEIFPNSIIELLFIIPILSLFFRLKSVATTMATNPNTWEFAEKPDCDLLLDESLDFEPNSEPELPVYAVVCDVDGEPLPADDADAAVEPTPANRSLDDEGDDEDDDVDMATGQQPSPPGTCQPLTNADHALDDSGDYEDINDLLVRCQGVNKTHNASADDPAKYLYPVRILEEYSLPPINKPSLHMKTPPPPDPAATVTNRPRTTTSASGLVGIKQPLDVHQPLTARDLGHYKPFTNLYRDNNGKETRDYGSRVVPGNSDRSHGAFNSDSRSTSTVVHGNNTIPPRGPTLDDLPEDPYTISASVMHDGFGCACIPNAGAHKIKADNPILLILGDGFVPPCIGGNGRCAVVIRVDRATPDTILTAAKNFFKATGDAAFSIPANSVIIISMTSYLLEVKAAMYLAAVDALKRNLAKLFFTRSPASCSELNTALECNVTAMNYRFIDVIVPHSPVDVQAAVAAATVVHVATVVAGATEDQLLGTIPNTYNTFMADSDSTTLHSEIPPYLILNSLSGNVSKKTVCTAATRVLAYEGVANGMNAELIVTFWCQIANKVKAYVAEKHISFINFPSGTDIKLGIANPCLADITSKTFPSIHLWMAERMPKPRPTIKSRLHTSAKPNPTPSTTITSKAARKLVLVGYSQMSIAASQLKQNWPDTNVVSISPPLNNNQNRMLTYESADKLCDILNGDSGSADDGVYILNEGDVVVIDLFSNGLLITPANPSISTRPLSSKMMVDGREVNSLHLVSRTKDKNGRNYKFGICHEDDINGLVSLVAGFARYVEKRTKSLVVILGPLPRFPLPCCDNPAHTLTDGANNKTLLRLIRDLNLFVGVSDQLNTVRSGGLIVGLPFDVVVAGVPGLASPYDCAKIVKADNLHCHAWVINRLNNILISMSKVPTKDIAKSIGFSPSNPICTSFPFSSWQSRLLFCFFSTDNWYLPSVNCSGKLSINAQDPDTETQPKTTLGKKRPAASSRCPSSGHSASRQPHPATPSHPATTAHPAPRHNHNPSISRIVNRPNSLSATPQPLMSLTLPSPSAGSAASRGGIHARLGRHLASSSSNINSSRSSGTKRGRRN